MEHNVYLNGTLVWLVPAVCPHVSVELSDGWVLLATGGALVPGGEGRGKRKGERREGRGEDKGRKEGGGRMERRKGGREKERKGKGKRWNEEKRIDNLTTTLDNNNS